MKASYSLKRKANPSVCPIEDIVAMNETTVCTSKNSHIWKPAIGNRM